MKMVMAVWRILTIFFIFLNQMMWKTQRKFGSSFFKFFVFYRILVVLALNLAPFSAPKRGKTSFGTLPKKSSNFGGHFLNFCSILGPPKGAKSGRANLRRPLFGLFFGTFFGLWISFSMYILGLGPSTLSQITQHIKTIDLVQSRPRSS